MSLPKSVYNGAFSRPGFRSNAPIQNNRKRTMGRKIQATTEVGYSCNKRGILVKDKTIFIKHS